MFNLKYTWQIYKKKIEWPEFQQKNIKNVLGEQRVMLIIES